jgi:hypothetical protein
MWTQISFFVSHRLDVLDLTPGDSGCHIARLLCLGDAPWCACVGVVVLGSAVSVGVFIPLELPLSVQQQLLRSLLPVGLLQISLLSKGF